jgi:hypothetical protein
MQAKCEYKAAADAYAISAHAGRDVCAPSYPFALNARVMRARMPALHPEGVAVLSLRAVGDGVEEKRQCCDALAAILRAEAEHDDAAFAALHFNDGGFACDLFRA